jgi:hypothetical protein
MPRDMHSSPAQVHSNHYRRSPSARHHAATVRPATQARVVAMDETTDVRWKSQNILWAMAVGLGAFLGWAALVLILG